MIAILKMTRMKTRMTTMMERRVELVDSEAKVATDTCSTLNLLTITSDISTRSRAFSAGTCLSNTCPSFLRSIFS